MQKTSAFILITIQAGKSLEILEQIKTVHGVKNAYLVTGPYDIIVLIEDDTTETVGNRVINRLHIIPGITHTMTCIVIS